MKLSITKTGDSRSNVLLREISSLSGMTNVLKSIKIRRSTRQIRWEKIFRSSLVLIALSILILVISFLLTLIVQSMPSIKALGFGFLTGKTWDPVANVYGTYPFLLGTSINFFFGTIDINPVFICYCHFFR